MKVLGSYVSGCNEMKFEGEIWWVCIFFPLFTPKPQLCVMLSMAILRPQAAGHWWCRHCIRQFQSHLRRRMLLPNIVLTSLCFHSNTARWSGRWTDCQLLYAAYLNNLEGSNQIQFQCPTQTNFLNLFLNRNATHYFVTETNTISRNVPVHLLDMTITYHTMRRNTPSESPWITAKGLDANHCLGTWLLQIHLLWTDALLHRLELSMYLKWSQESICISLSSVYPNAPQINHFMTCLVYDSLGHGHE